MQHVLFIADMHAYVVVPPFDTNKRVHSLCVLVIDFH